MAFRRVRSSLSRQRYLVAALCIVVSISCVWLAVALTSEEQAQAADPHSPLSPVGVPGGLHPGRVVWVHDPNATDWLGPRLGDGYWWQSNHTDQEVVNEMMSKAIQALAGEPNVATAWDMLFRDFNSRQGKGDVGYQPSEQIMIKVNFVDMIAIGGNTDYDLVDHTPEYPICSPQIMHALLDQLVNVVGVAQSNITIGDPICLWCHEFYNIIQPDFSNVRYLDYLGLYGRTKMQKSGVPFYWSTTKADGRTQDYVLQSYVEAEYFINLASLKGHYNQAGITLCAKNHYGSLRGPAAGGYYDMHSDCPFNISQSGSYRNMVDLMGHRHIGGKTFLAMIDGLYAGKHALGYPNNLPLKWQMQPFGDDWPSSIFVSQDQVAIDSVGFDFLVTEWPEGNGPAHEGTDDYLHEAAQADNPPSGTFYDPEKDGTRLASLGVHEHWNNPVDKQYSGNLAMPGGIELVKIPADRVRGDVDGDRLVDLRDVAAMSNQWLDWIVYSETDGHVGMETERYSARTAGSGSAHGAVWCRSRSEEASGERYLQVLPDNGLTLTTDIEMDSPSLSYLVNFTTPGEYYLWFKAAATDTESDSLYYGIDGAVTIGHNTYAVLSQPYEETLITKEAFNWLYLDIGREQTGWTDRLFDDTGWREGQARLGYGNDGENKEVRYGPNEDNTQNNASNKYITTYFRKHFTIANPSAFSSLRLSVVRDDGVVAYLNGDEVARCKNMPSGPVNYYTICRGYAVSGSEEQAFLDFKVVPAELNAGDNVIAAEVHQYAPSGQNNITSADIGLDLELIGRSAFVWRSQRADGTRPVINVAEAGIHAIHIWMREDGVKLDRISLTTDELYDPTVKEPDESPYLPFFQIIADLNDDGIVDLADFSLTGSNWLSSDSLY